MRITDKELDTLLKSGEAHSVDKRFNFRGAQENTGKNSTVKRFSLIAAALAIILIVSSIPVIAFVANKKAPAPAEVTEGVVTEELTVTNENNDLNDNTGIVTDANGSETEEEKTDETSYEPTKEEIIEYANSAMKPYKEFHIFAIDGFSWLKGGDVKLTLEEHGVNSWMTKGEDFYKRYYIEHDYEGNRSKVGDNMYRYVPTFYYGKKEPGDIHEFDITIVYDHEAKCENALLYIEADGAEILSDNVIKAKIVDFPEEDEYNYLTYHIKYRFTDGHALARFYTVEFYNEDKIAKAEEIINSGEKLLMPERSLGHTAKIIEEFYGYNIYPLTLFKIKDTVFACQIKDDLQYMYDLAAVYFGDIDEHNTPLYMKDPYMQDYFECPWCVNKRKEIEGK